MDVTLRTYFAATASRLYGVDNFNARCRMFEEIAEVREFQSTSSDGSTLTFVVQAVDAAAAPAAVRGNEHALWRNQVFLATTSTSVDVEAIGARDERLSGTSPAELAFHASTGDGEKFIGDLMLLANLAQPGSLEVANAASSIDGYERLDTHASLANSLYRVTKRATELGWPRIGEIPLQKAWSWGQQLPGFSDGIIPGSIGRALSAASFLIVGDEGGPADLTWALMGLEALFSRGNQGLKAQIIEKSAVLLGRPHAFRRKFDGIYDYRSRFVHGDLDIPLAHCRRYASTEIKSFDSEVDECKLLATAILVAALQRCIERGSQSLEFDYVLRGEAATPEAQ